MFELKGLSKKFKVTNAEIRKNSNPGSVIEGSNVEIPTNRITIEKLSTAKFTIWLNPTVIALFAPSIATPEMY
jgi:hypothetical protein